MHKIKIHFIPHKDNDHHAPALHRKRHLWYGLLGLALKAAVVLVTVLLPLEVFVTTDALDAQLVDIIEQTNEIRTEVGESVLTSEALLHISATRKAEDMRDHAYFSHESPNGDRVGDLVRAAGYDFIFAGENLSVGYAMAGDVVTAWKESPTHYRNLVYPAFEDIGVGVSIRVTEEGLPVPYFVQHFGTSKAPEGQVLGETETLVDVLPQSRVFWKEVSGGIHISAQVFLTGEITDIVITQFSEDIELTYDHAGMYSAEALLTVTKEDLFSPALPVAIRMTQSDGTIVESLVSWEDPAILAPSLTTRYHMAVQYVDDVLPLIIISRAIFLLMIGVLLFALLSHMAWSLHTHKHRITFEAMLTMGLFILLIII